MEKLKLFIDETLQIKNKTMQEKNLFCRNYMYIVCYIEDKSIISSETMERHRMKEYNKNSLKRLRRYLKDVSI